MHVYIYTLLYGIFTFIYKHVDMGLQMERENKTKERIQAVHVISA